MVQLAIQNNQRITLANVIAPESDLPTDNFLTDISNNFDGLWYARKAQRYKVFYGLPQLESIPM